MASDSDSKTSDDPLVEINLHHLVKKSQITDDNIRNMIVKCTACGKQLNHHSSKKKIRQHLHLKVLICEDCQDFYGNGEFSQDEDGDKYCRWCGNGGKLYGCDYCTNSFCIDCIRRNFGRGEIREIQDKNWKCYHCDFFKLEHKVSYCDLIIEYSRDETRWQRKKVTTLPCVGDVDDGTQSHAFLNQCFVGCESSCSKLQNRIKKLKEIRFAKSKSVKQIYKKMLQIADTHKCEMKNFISELSYQYSLYVKQKSELPTQENDEENKANNVQEPTVDEKNFSNNVACNKITGNSDAENISTHEVKIDVNCETPDFNGINEPQSDILNDLEDKISDCIKKLDSDPVSDVTENNDKNNKDSIKIDNETPNEISENDQEDGIEPNSPSLLDVKDDSNSEKINNNITGADEFLKFLDVSDSNDSSGSDDDKRSKDKMCIDNSILSSESNKILSKDKVDREDSKNENVPCENGKIKPLSNSISIIPESDIESSKSDYNSSNEVSHSKSSNSRITPKKKVYRKKKSESSGSAISLGTSSESELEKNVIKTIKNKKQVGNLISQVKSESDVKDVNIEDLLNDPKLKLESYVVLRKLDIATITNSSNVTKMETTDAPEVDDVAELKKAYESLCRLPKAKKSSDKQKENKTQLKPKSKTKKVEENDSESESIAFSSDENSNSKFPDMSFKDSSNLLAKDSLLQKIESSDESDISSESEGSSIGKKKTAKKTSTSKDLNSASSSDDFQPRKKSKYDKLLREPISFPDDKEKDEKKQKKIEKKKRTKRKILSSGESKDSDDSSSEITSDSDFETKKSSKPKSKKRKRIKQMSGSSNESGDEKGKKDSDVEILGSQGKGRKNIRKVISKEELAEETKEAQLIEKERKRRLQERQKLYNKIEERSKDGTELITKKMVLEVDPNSKEEVVEIHPDIIEMLKPHQINGVKFMWESTIESLKELETKPGSGCILAHCMGLGKTLQVIAFLYTCLTNKHVKKKIKNALVICPYNTILNWAKEFEYWLQHAEEEILLHQMSNAKDNHTRLDILKYWSKEGGVLIIGYDIFRRLVEGKMARFPKKLKEKAFDILTTAPDIVICDEGHILKNETSSISKATSKLKTKRRIVLTGTPLQNNLKEYHCMLQFVKPHLLGTSKEFRNRFVHPITNGQYDDSSQRDVKLMKKRVHILHKLLEGCVQRCDYSTLTKFLPPKHEFVISVKLSEVQIKMYRHYLDKISECKTQVKIEGRTLFSDYNSLKNIWTFPYICHMSFKRAEDRKIRKGIFSDEEEFINDNSDNSIYSSSSAEDPDNPKPSTSKRKDESSEDEVVRTYKTRSRANKDGSDNESSDDEPMEERKNWYHEFISEEDRYKIELSGKMVLLLDILKECEAIGDKIIVFSQALLTLDMIEDILAHMDEQPLTEEDKTRDVIGTWVKGLDYFRMDGATSADFRKRWIEMFNNVKNERARLFLISTKAGSLGTNLVGANRVVLLDASWNPSHDVQAIFRVYRFGQTKPVYIYRLLAQGTMEEKIYDRQVTKLSLSIRVVDEQQIDRHFNAAELAELYSFNPDSTSSRPTPIVPKDRLLAEMLIRNKDWIVTYHEHDSLLQNETEEDLTEEERQAAWNEYENEKEGLINSFSNDLNSDSDLFNELDKEPDFNSADSSSEIKPPNVEEAMKLIIAKINVLYPAADPSVKMQKIFEALCRLRSMYQLKHVRVLRLKQECFNKEVSQQQIGAINTYLEGLVKAMKWLAIYINTLSTKINEFKKAAQEQAFAKMQANVPPKMTNQQTFTMPNNRNPYGNTYYQYYGTRTPTMHFQAAPAQNIPTVNPSYTYTDVETGKVYASRPVTRDPKTYSKPHNVKSNSGSSSPVVIEFDENSVPDSTTNIEQSSSSVVITEID